MPWLVGMAQLVGASSHRPKGHWVQFPSFLLSPTSSFTESDKKMSSGED